jgi:hypothetical protein
MNVLASFYRTAFRLGGLALVDSEISSLSKRLRASGTRFGIGPGTALMEGDTGLTEWIAVIFSDFATGEFILLEWCRLSTPV